jgi:transcriptional regulator with XRE-family HTH domain
MPLPEKLRKLRKDKSWTQKYLSTKINISRSAISKFETGEQVPSVDVLTRYAHLFQVEQTYLLSELTGSSQSMEQRSPYLSKKRDDDWHLLEEILRKNPNAKKIILDIDQLPFKEQQKLYDTIHILIKGMKKSK